MSFMTIEEAWGELPVRHSLPPDASSLTYDEMNELPGYNYARCETNTNDIATYVPKKINKTENKEFKMENEETKMENKETKMENEEKKESRVQSSVPIKKRNINVNNIPVELINASLYIVSGIYIIYIMDMFTRIGLSI